MLARRGLNLRKSDYGAINEALRSLEVEASSGRISNRNGESHLPESTSSSSTPTSAPHMRDAAAEQGAMSSKSSRRAVAPERGTPHFQVLNRSKRSVSLDIASTDGKWSIAALVKSADNRHNRLHAYQAEAQGLNYASIRKTNPHALVLNFRPSAAAVPRPSSMRATLSSPRGPESRAANGRAAAIRSRWYSLLRVIRPGDGRERGGGGPHRARAYRRGSGARGPLLAGALSLQTGGVLKHGRR